MASIGQTVFNSERQIGGYPARCRGKITQNRPHLDTGGGTSDARFIALMGAEVVEFGPLNKTIHKVDECVNVDDLAKCGEVYQHVLCNMLERV